MTGDRAQRTSEVVHPVLAPARSTQPLAAARLTDRQRLGLLLEGAALLSLLQRAGWWLPLGWAGAAVAETGRLSLPPGATRAGRPQRPPQELLRELLLRAFGAGGDGGPDCSGGVGEGLGGGGDSVGGWSGGAGAGHGRGDGAAAGSVAPFGAASAGSITVAGRGQARRAARTLLSHWWQALVPLPADEAVTQIVAAAPFLWEPAFAASRESLAGEVREAGAVSLWVAGPGAVRRRLLAGCASLLDVQTRLAGAAARAWWDGAPMTVGTAAPGAVPEGTAGPEPEGTAGAGPAGAAGPVAPGSGALPAAGVADGSAGRPARRWREVAAAARRQPPGTEPGRVELGDALLNLGRFEAALETLASCRSATARLVRTRCQVQLGRLGAARAGLRRLEALPLTASETIEAAEIAVRVFANSGEPERLPRWVERALAASAPAAAPERARARLVAAVAAWDRQLPAEMDEHLEAARAELFAGGGTAAVEAASEAAPAAVAAAGAAPAALAAAGTAAGAGAGGAGVIWRWHHACALRAMAAADGGAMEEHASRALREGRRGLARHQAAGLWNDLGIGRVQAGDLAGAERAFLHAQRLFSGCDGPRRTTLALHNLAEVRLRRGRVGGVREILERSAAENRGSGNLRGLSQDAELWARLELVLGRPEAAAAICREAIERLDRRRFPWRRDVLEALAGRALGWLERPADAAAALARASPEALAELEPEERPAVWANAGDHAAAGRAAAATPSPAGPLWQAVLAGKTPPAAAWQALAALEPYRAARLVFDLERAAGEARGVAPAEWRAPAVATLRRMGAGGMADWLEARDAGPWEALADYAARSGGGDLQAAVALLRQAGGPDVRLAWVAAGEAIAADAEPAALLLAADLPQGRLELRGPLLAPAAAACFKLAARDLTASPAAFAPAATPPGAAARRQGSGGAASRLIGSSAVLRAATVRLRRLAAVEMPVLIRGESGTGKELAAREIHRASTRSAGPFLAINCAAVAESLLMSDLFGHARGAFTGADRERAGVFETARGGIVLLDEIGDLPLGAQGLLLRVLQEAEVRRLGESLPRPVDVRTLAATHRDLAKAVAAGTFREDLFYRLRVGAVELPPLRDRGDDVLELADHFLPRCLAGSPGLPGPVPRLTPAARDCLRRHPWPGNVRELENVLRVAAALAEEGLIQPHHLELPAASGAAAAPSGFYHQQIESFRRRMLADALANAGGRHALAARRLGISRQAFSYLVRQLDLRS